MFGSGGEAAVQPAKERVLGHRDPEGTVLQHLPGRVTPLPSLKSGMLKYVECCTAVLYDSFFWLFWYIFSI